LVAMTTAWWWGCPTHAGYWRSCQTRSATCPALWWTWPTAHLRRPCDGITARGGVAVPGSSGHRPSYRLSHRPSRPAPSRGWRDVASALRNPAAPWAAAPAKVPRELPAAGVGEQAAKFLTVKLRDKLEAQDNLGWALHQPALNSEVRYPRYGNVGDEHPTGELRPKRHRHNAPCCVCCLRAHHLERTSDAAAARVDSVARPCTSGTYLSLGVLDCQTHPRFLMTPMTYMVFPQPPTTAPNTALHPYLARPGLRWLDLHQPPQPSPLGRNRRARDRLRPPPLRRRVLVRHD